MNYGKNILNNLMMKSNRKNPVYQTIITDLALTGNLSRGDAESLLGYKIPDFLTAPDGSKISDYDNEESVTKKDIKPSVEEEK